MSSVNGDCLPVVKILLLGDSGVGKTCLLSRYTTGEFDIHSRATIAVDFLTHVVHLPGMYGPVRTQIWDTAGQEKFHALASVLYRGTHGVLIVFDLTIRSTFDHVQGWVRNLREHCPNEKIPIVVVGNKLDLIHLRAVTNDEGATLAASLGASYIEASAAEITNVELCFISLVEKIRERFLVGGIDGEEDQQKAQRPAGVAHPLQPQQGGGKPHSGRKIFKIFSSTANEAAEKEKTTKCRCVSS